MIGHPISHDISLKALCECGHNFSLHYEEGLTENPTKLLTALREIEKVYRMPNAKKTQFITFLLTY